MLVAQGCSSFGGTALGDGSTALRNAELQLFDLVNAHRESRSLPALSYSASIAEVARVHSEAMATGTAAFSHDGIDLRAALIARKFDFEDFGENLVAVYPASYQTLWRPVAGWLGSESHRRTLEGCYDLSGVGIAADGEGSMFVTQIFVRRSPRWPCPSQRSDGA